MAAFCFPSYTGGDKREVNFKKVNYVPLRGTETVKPLCLWSNREGSYLLSTPSA